MGSELVKRAPTTCRVSTAGHEPRLHYSSSRLRLESLPVQAGTGAVQCRCAAAADQHARAALESQACNPQKPAACTRPNYSGPGERGGYGYAACRCACLLPPATVDAAARRPCGPKTRGSRPGNGRPQPVHYKKGQAMAIRARGFLFPALQLTHDLGQPDSDEPKVCMYTSRRSAPQHRPGPVHVPRLHLTLLRPSLPPPLPPAAFEAAAASLCSSVVPGPGPPAAALFSPPPSPSTTAAAPSAAAAAAAACENGSQEVGVRGSVWASRSAAARQGDMHPLARRGAWVPL